MSECYVDTGVTKHIINQKELFVRCIKFHKPELVRLVNGAEIDSIKNRVYLPGKN